MRIAVCVKSVPDGRLHIDTDSMRLDRNGPGELNDVDRYAIEESLRLREARRAEDATAETEVVIVSIGPRGATESVRSALAIGADRAVLVTDDALAGSDLVATAKVLTRVLEREQPDLVLFGQQTRDGGGGVLWAAVADLLRQPFASQAAGLALDGTVVRVTRQTEVGDEVIEVDLPALVAVGDSINEPRYASLKGLMGAKKKPLEVLELSDVGLTDADVGSAGSKTEVLAVGPPPARAAAARIDDETDAAQAIVDFLVEKQLL